jgi:acetylglutamate kinase
MNLKYLINYAKKFRKNNMKRITLEEARQLTNDALIGYQNIVEKIKSAARNGEHYVDIPSEKLSINISSKLERDGFDISYHVINNIEIHRIFWGY